MSIPSWGRSQGIPVSSPPVPHHPPLPNFLPLSALWAHSLCTSVTWWAYLQCCQTSHTERGFVHDLGQRRNQETQLDQEAKNLCLFLAETEASKPPGGLPLESVSCLMSLALSGPSPFLASLYFRSGQGHSKGTIPRDHLRLSQACLLLFIFMVLVF